MRAALIHAIGEAPRLGDAPEPRAGPSDALLELAAASLNPVDLAIATGRYFGGHPPLPFVAGSEGVGRVVGGDRWPEGTLVYAIRSPSGTLADRFLAGESAWELPAGAGPEAAVALGIAGLAGWIAVEHRGRLAPGERVLVLAATGTVGLTAVQAARILGARRIVAAGRDRERLRRAAERGADETVVIGDGDLEEAFRAAFPDGGPDLVIDPLWGEPAKAAIAVAAPRARIVNLGQSAGAAAELTSASIRGPQIEIIGQTVFKVSPDVLEPAHRRMIEATAAGELVIDVDRFPLAAIGDAWGALQQGGDRKAVVTP